MAFGNQVEATVGAVTDTGPRHVNADRFFTSQSPGDGSWVIAVADGVGGHPEAPDAAAAAVESLPERIGSLDAMRDAFVVAADRVAAMAPSREDFRAAERAQLGDRSADTRRMRMCLLAYQVLLLVRALDARRRVDPNFDMSGFFGGITPNDRASPPT